MNDESGSAPLDSVFAIVLLLVLMLGALQVAYVLYARNVLMSAAHEGVRAAVERGTSTGEAASVIAGVVERSTGGLVSDLRVDTATRSGVVTVRARGTVAPVGPVPVAIPLSATATATTR